MAKSKKTNKKEKQHNPNPTYAKVVLAVKSKKLKEPFLPNDLVEPCGIKARAASSFPSRYRRGNPQGRPTYFVRLKDGRYKVIRPFRYGL